MSEPTRRILLVEDQPVQVELLVASLQVTRRGRFDVTVVDRLSTAAERLRERRFDLVLLDLGLPDGQGLDSLTAIRRSAGRVPIVVLTGQDDEQLAIDTLKQGAQDYLVKGRHDPDAVARAILYAIERARLDEALVLEERLRRSEARLAEAQQIAQLGSWELDLELGTESWSAELRRILGVDPSTPPCRARLLAQIDAPDQERIARLYAGAMSRCAPFDAEYRIVRAGGVRHVHEHARVTLGHDGRPQRLVGTIQDITDRTALQRQLQQAERLASAGTLAGSVAHEINNPLTYLVSNLEFVRDVLLQGPCGACPAHLRSPDLVVALDDALAGADRVRSIVDDLRTLSRPVEERLAPVALHGVLETTTRMAWSQIRDRATLVREYADVPPVLASELRLGQVFLNLIVNAAQAIPEGAPHQHRIVIGTRVDGPEHVLVTVADTGVGIPPAALGRLFEPFFTTKGSHGTGLGLSICHRIVDALRGEIRVASELGKGTTFTVRLPIAHEPVRCPPAEPSTSSRPATPRARSGRVLVIDDEPLIGKAISRGLAPDHTVVSLTRGRDGLNRLLSADRFDLVLCDLSLPDLGGQELHEQLAHRAPEAAERIVFMTGGELTATARSFLEATPNPRVEKPVALDRIRSLLAERLGGGSHDTT